MTSALCHLQMKEILHRDVKPGNIAQSEHASTSNWKLLDFDSACHLNSPQQAECMGETMLYYSPEVLSGRYDMRRDVFALGVTLVEVSQTPMPLFEWLMCEESRRPYASDVAASLGGDVA